MPRFAFSDVSKHTWLICTCLAVLISCDRIPKPDFSFLPRENVEAGDTLWFTNQTRGNYAFEWNFGDGSVSYESDPKHVYQIPGIYDATLSASEGSDIGFVSYSIFVNDPTVLGFIVSDSTGSQKLSDAEVWVYTNGTARDNLTAPLFKGSTDSEGIIDFYNLEPRVYHIWVVKQGEDGYWAYKGFTTSLKQNRVNRFTVPCIWFADP